MAVAFLLDANAVIDFLGGKLPAGAKDLLLETEPAISVITRTELFSSSNIQFTERSMLEDFVNASVIYNTLDADIVAKTIGLRQSHKIKTPDAIIAATAMAHDLTLVTRNMRDFKNIDGLKLVDPYQR